MDLDSLTVWTTSTDSEKSAHELAKEMGCKNYTIGCYMSGRYVCLGDFQSNGYRQEID